MLAMQLMRGVALACVVLSQPMSTATATDPSAVQKKAATPNASMEAPAGAVAIDVARSHDSGQAACGASALDGSTVPCHWALPPCTTQPALVGRLIDLQIRLSYLDFTHALAAP